MSGERHRQRRKVALACEPCRARKSRCDGAMPICATCQRRGLSLEQCIYKADNARTANTEAYLKVLHQRIRHLEDVCRRAGISTQPVSTEDGHLPEQANESHTTSEGPQVVREAQSREVEESQSFHDADAAEPALTLLEMSSGLLVSGTGPGNEGAAVHDHTDGDREMAQNHSTTDPQPDEPVRERASPWSGQWLGVSGMGSVSVAEQDMPSANPDEFYGGSSTVSFLEETQGVMEPKFSIPSPHTSRENPTSTSQFSSPCLNPELWCRPSVAQLSSFTLPPRQLADHLLERFWERVYPLYPLFSRPAFEAAYEQIWNSKHPLRSNLHGAKIGLGGDTETFANIMVFHAALNVMFALACHFSDLPPSKRESVAYSFFLRSKELVGLDFLDVNNLAVVQCLLLISLYLQSSPYPSRCWNAVGLAIRLAQGLGLHVERKNSGLDPVIKDIRRRTWYGCVILDNLVSMTLGRPTTTIHNSVVPIQFGMEVNETGSSMQERQHSMQFFEQTARLMRILHKILKEVYEPWFDGSSSWQAPHAADGGFNRLDVIMDLDTELFSFEASLPACLSWRTGLQEPEDGCKLQRIVLQARWLHIRMLLFRPIFTQVFRAKKDCDGVSSIPKTVLVRSFYENCASSCLQSAIELVDHVYKHYQSSTTSAWWYNSLYASTAGIVFIVVNSSSKQIKSDEHVQVSRAWAQCIEILQELATFSSSSRNQLLLLQYAYEHKASNASHPMTTSNHETDKRQELTRSLHADTHQVTDEASTNLDFGSFEVSNQSHHFAPEVQADEVWLSNWMSSFSTPDGMGLFDPAHFIDFADSRS